MTPGQRRRLEAVVVARIRPCLGCLQEDTIDAVRKRDDFEVIQQLFAKLRWAKNKRRAMNGEGPVPEPSEEERQEARHEGERQKAQAISVLRQLEQDKRQLLRSVRPGKLRSSCPSCTPRRRSREHVTALVARLSAVARDRAADDAEYGPDGEMP